jgi:hypothetical protein
VKGSSAEDRAFFRVLSTTVYRSPSVGVRDSRVHPCPSETYLKASAGVADGPDGCSCADFGISTEGITIIG